MLIAPAIATNAASAVAVTAVSLCSRITVGESPAVVGYPTTDYLVSATAAGTARRISAGQSYTFSKNTPILPGDIVGYIKNVAGTSTFYQDEGGI